MSSTEITLDPVHAWSNTEELPLTNPEDNVEIAPWLAPSSLEPPSPQRRRPTFVVLSSVKKSSSFFARRKASDTTLAESYQSSGTTESQRSSGSGVLSKLRRSLSRPNLHKQAYEPPPVLPPDTASTSSVISVPPSPPGKKPRKTPRNKPSSSLVAPQNAQDVVSIESIQSVPVSDIVRLDGYPNSHGSYTTSADTTSSPTADDLGDGDDDAGSWTSRFNHPITDSPPRAGPSFTHPFSGQSSSLVRRSVAESQRDITSAPITQLEPQRRLGSCGSTQICDSANAWAAPESWATVKEGDVPLETDGGSDEDEGTRLEPVPQVPSRISGKAEDRVNGRLLPPPRKSSHPNRNGQLPYLIRIHRLDGAYHVVSCPLNTTVAKLTPELHSKLSLPRETHRLYLRERGRERLLAQTEKPALIVRRRLENAGYDPVDGLEALGAEDLQFLLKFVFRSERLGGKEEREITPNSFEYVDLAGRSLQTVPIMLHRHAHSIVSLNLSKNPLLEIPLDFIQSCETLRELRLLNMAMKKVPQSVRHSSSLQRLDLSCNRICDLDEAELDRIPGLRDLKVQNNRLESIPLYFRDLHALCFLNISNNKFEVLPSVICEMTRLVDLDVSFNNISSLPKELGKLRHLERLVIVGNQVTEFPESCSELVNLSVLDCRRNNITDLSVICRLPRLETLRADYNMVHALDLSLGPSFKTLEVTHNDITRLALVPGPMGIAKPFSLTHLDISHAKLSSLDDFALAALTSLTSLKMDHNSFRSIPDVLCSLTSLTHLSCSDNQIDALPSNIGQLQKLVSLDAHNNDLGDVPTGLWNCGALVNINLTSNLITEWHDPPPVEREHDGAQESKAGAGEDGARFERKMSHVLPISPPLARSIKRLYLGDNRLDDDVFPPLTILKGLTVLNLSFNKIQEIPPFFLHSLPQLEELYLSGNKLTSFPSENLYKMTKLTTLFLNGNKLQTLPAELGKVQSLAVLDVGSNVLKYNVNNWEFDWNWNFNPQLRYLNLSGNKRLEIKPDPSLIKKSADLRTPQIQLQKQLAEFTGLRDLRVLGLMDVTTLFMPSIPDENEDRRVRTSFSEINGMGYGIADTLGKLEHVSMFDLVLPRFRSKHDECLFGMFGRVKPLPNNNKSTKFLHENFRMTFITALAALKKDGSEGVPDALRRAFLTMNKNLFDHLTTNGGRKMSAGSTGTDSLMAEASGLKTGASAVIVYMVKKTMYVANAGNALAVVSRKGVATLVSTKHDPFERSETTRIRNAEGWVSPKGKVNDDVGVSRSFGYYHLLPAVINPRPDVCNWSLTERDEFVIVGNRGLWDYVSYQHAVDIARPHRDEPMIAAQKLRDFAMSCGAEGCTMIMVICVADLFNGSRTRQQPADSTDHLNPYAAIKRTGPQRRQDDNIADRIIARLEPEVEPPRGHIALVFTDIRNSTFLWDKNAGMATAMKLHNNLLRRLLRLTGGYEVKTEGDAFMVSFSSVLSALHWCFMVQIQLLHEPWPLEILECEDGKEIRDSEGKLVARGLSVRMGVHCGTPYCERDPVTRRMDYLGPMVNRASRISQAAAGGQIMCSADVIREINERIFAAPPDLKGLDPDTAATIESIRMKGVKIVEKGEKRMKGLEVPEFLSLVYPGDLAGRVGLKEPGIDGHPSEDSSRVQFSEEQMRKLALLCLRLETLSSNRVFRHASQKPEATEAKSSAGDDIIMYADPGLLIPSIKDRSDEELTSLLDFLSVRIDNALSTLHLRRT